MAQNVSARAAVRIFDNQAIVPFDPFTPAGLEYRARFSASRNFELDSDTWLSTDSGIDSLFAAGAPAGSGDASLAATPQFADDVPADTSTTATIAVGGSVNVTIDSAGDHDWYAVTLEAFRYYTIQTTSSGSGIDPNIYLRDASGNLLASDDDGGDGLQSLIRFWPTVSGTYYIDAGTYNNLTTGGYRLIVAPNFTSFADPVGATAVTASSLAIGGTVNGLIDGSYDHDWYAVNLVAGQTYLFRTAPTSTASTTDTLLWLRDAAGNALAFNNDSGSGSYSAIRYTATATGTYYVDVSGYYNETGTFNLSAYSAPSVSVYTNDQIATQLTHDFWDGTARHWDVATGGTLTVNLTGLTSAGQYLARQALALWTDVTGIIFNEVATGGQITFDDSQAAAFSSSVVEAGFITSAQVNVGTFWLSIFGTGTVSYSFQTYIHEIGHALGLGHAGDYNGSAEYVVDSHYQNDSWATTIMSYFDQTENGYFSGQGFTGQFVVTPMVADIIAVQNLYGTPNTTRTGDNFYGRGEFTEPLPYSNTPSAVTMTIVDHGGSDTINYSGYRFNQRINLNPETFSNVGGGIGNLSIARGTQIENAIGGMRNDVLIGNAAANRLEGGSGDDEFTGGLGSDRLIGDGGSDTAIYAGNRNEYDIVTAGGVTTVTGLGARASEGPDTLTAIEFIRFANLTVALGGDTNNPVELGETPFPDFTFDDSTDFTFYFPGTAFFDLDAGTVLTYAATLVDGSPLPAWLTFDPANLIFTGNAPVSAIDSFVEIRLTASDQSTSVSDIFNVRINQAPGAPVEGTDGADLLYGTFRSETMVGLAGDDRFFGSVGIDWIYGGEGTNDIVDYGASSAGVTVNLASGSSAAGGDAEGDYLTELESVRGSNFGDTLTGTVDNNQIFGMGGDDTIDGRDGNDLLSGGDGNDVLFAYGNGIYHGDNGNDTLHAQGNGSYYGDAGDDTLVVSRSGDLTGLTIDGGAGFDTVRFFGSDMTQATVSSIEAIELTGYQVTLTNAQLESGFAANTLLIGSGVLVINMGSDNTLFTQQMRLAPDASLLSMVINAGDNINVVKVQGFTPITYNGGSLTDQVRGSQLADTINGGNGNDKIFGWAGADVLTGGAGADQFRYFFATDSLIGESDTITDFTIGEDRLNFTLIDADANTSGDQAFSFIGTAGFTASGLGQIRFDDSSGDMMVQVDVDGNGTADMEIVLQSLYGQTLTAADFML